MMALQGESGMAREEECATNAAVRPLWMTQSDYCDRFGCNDRWMCGVDGSGLWVKQQWAAGLPQVQDDANGIAQLRQRVCK